MKKISVLVVPLILLYATVALPAGVEWVSLEDGTERAKAERKPMLVDFYYGAGCPRCEVLDKNVYGNQAIARKIMDDFVPIRVDLTKPLTPAEERLGTQYDFKNDCLLLFLDHKGNVMKDPGGKRLCFADNIDPELFINYLDMVKAAIKGK